MCAPGTVYRWEKRNVRNVIYLVSTAGTGEGFLVKGAVHASRRVAVHRSASSEATGPGFAILIASTADRS